MKMKKKVLVTHHGLKSYLLLDAIASANTFACILIAMIIQLVIELRHGMSTASRKTKVYQTRAVRSLILQGVIPSLFFLLPAVCPRILSTRSFPRHRCDCKRKASTVSILCVNVLSLHALAHSLTVLACSPAYRKIALNIIRKALYGI
ncbi:hypothetical protein PMAYCL1PPCAC_22285, partial [Pristionchus mayeri]